MAKVIFDHSYGRGGRVTSTDHKTWQAFHQGKELGTFHELAQAIKAARRGNRTGRQISIDKEKESVK